MFTVVSHGQGFGKSLGFIVYRPMPYRIHISPGMAIDHKGNAIVVTDPINLDVESTRKGTLYIVIQYDDKNPKDVGSDGADSGKAQSRVRQAGKPEYTIEFYDPWTQWDRPSDPALELARIDIDGTKTPIQNAQDPTTPKANEIDMRYRFVAGHIGR